MLLGQKRSNFEFNKSSQPHLSLKKEPPAATSLNNLPAINKAALNVSHIHETSENKKFHNRSELSHATLSTMTGANPLRLVQQELSEGEPITRNSKVLRNKVGYYMSSNLSQARLQKTGKPVKNASGATDLTKKQAYNFGGYVSRAEAAREVQASFFNSKQGDSIMSLLKHSSGSTLLQRQASLIKNATKQRRKRASPLRAQSILQDLQSSTSGEIMQFGAFSNTPEMQKSVETAFLVNHPLASSEGTGSDAFMENTLQILKNNSSGVNSLVPQSKKQTEAVTPASEHQVTAESRVANNKICAHGMMTEKIKAPHGTIEKNLRAMPASQWRDVSMASLDMVSAPKGENYNSGRDLPSIAGAQARPMLRKPANKLSFNKDSGLKLVSQKRKETSIEGIYGDALHRGDSNSSQKQVILKPQKNKEKRGLQGRSKFATSQMVAESKEFSANDLSKRVYEQADEIVSVQKSLFDTHSVLQEGQPIQQQSIVSSSSGQQVRSTNVVMSMLERLPIYNGDLEGKKEVPQSSLNLTPYEKQDQDAGKRLSTPSQSLPENKTPQSRAVSEVFHKSFFLKNTQISFNSTKLREEAGVPSLYGTGNMVRRNNKQLTGSQDRLEDPTQIPKARTPFQKFQESIKRLELSPTEIPTATYMMLFDNSQATPIFKQKEKSKRLSSGGGIGSGVGQALSGTQAMTAVQARKSRESWNSRHYGNLDAAMNIQGSNYGSNIDFKGSRDTHQKPKPNQKSVTSSTLGKNKSNQAPIYHQADIKSRVQSDELVNSIKESKILQVVKIDVGAAVSRPAPPRASAVHSNSTGQNDITGHQSLGQTDLLDDRFITRMNSEEMEVEPKNDLHVRTISRNEGQVQTQFSVVTKRVNSRESQNFDTLTRNQDLVQHVGSLGPPSLAEIADESDS